MQPLYKISNEYQNLFELLGEDEADNEAVLQAIEKKDVEVKEKLKVTSYCVANLEALHAQIIRREKQIKKHRASVESKLLWLSNYLMKHMRECGEKEIVTDEFTMKLKVNPESTVIDDENLIPDIYLKATTKYSPVRTAIKEAIKGGELVPGAHLERTIKLVIL